MRGRHFRRCFSAWMRLLHLETSHDRALAAGILVAAAILGARLVAILVE